MTTDELHVCFAMVTAAWPHFKPIPETFSLGQRLLGQLDGRAVAAAIEQFSLEGREFAPPLGLVAKRAHELVAQARGESVPDVHQALGEVQRQMHKTGRYALPEWSHPAIESTVDAMGGWVECCDSENPEAFRAHFFRLYDVMRARVEREALMAPSLRELYADLADKMALPKSPLELDA